MVMHDAPSSVTADDVRSATFSKPPFGQRGYDAKSVNDFLQLAARRLDGRGHLRAADVHNIRFGPPKLLRFRQGYRKDEVDTLLARIAATVTELDGRPQ